MVAVSPKCLPRHNTDNPRNLCKLNFLVFLTSLSGYHISTCFHIGAKNGKKNRKVYRSYFSVAS